MAESLSGTIERVTFHNPENGFAVLRVQVPKRKHPVTVVGQVPRAIAGEYLEATGAWQKDPEHGEQFKAASIRTAAPSSAEGIEKFLGSGLIKGIGPQYAKKIVKVFGSRTLQVIDESPSFLKEVKGLGPRRIQQIRLGWKEQKAVRDIMVFLQSHGLGTARAFRIWKTYGDKALELVRGNPYRLADDIWGIGFSTADALARRLGMEESSPLRMQAAMRHLLKEASHDGHCALPQEELLERTQKLLDGEVARLRPELQRALEELVKENAVVRSSDAGPAPWIYLPWLYHAEVHVAKRLRELLQGKHPLAGIDVARALDWVQKQMSISLADGQAAAIRQAVTQKVLVITGGPGVGKTTIVRGILEIFLAKKLNCRLAAPTGRAAKRLSESTGREALTLHRLLEYGAGGAKRDAERPLDLDVLIVDETSMVDILLMNNLLRALPARACLILVGDVDQLPSVGPGFVLGDLIASRAVPVARLTEIFRQAQDSGIVQAAHAILHGKKPQSAPPDKLGDFYFVESEQPEQILERVLTLLQERIPARFHLDPFRDVQVLTPMNRADLGVFQLNQRLQEALNPLVGEAPAHGAGGLHEAPREDTQVERFGVAFRIGDKVLQTVNNYDKDVFNGDVGRVRAIDLEEQEMAIDFDGRKVVYHFNELDELSLAYALTIHKSQGSEYPAVILPLHTQHFLLLRRNLLYTAVTRGKKLVVIVGSAKALEIAVNRHETQTRYTALTRRLSQPDSH